MKYRIYFSPIPYAYLLAMTGLVFLFDFIDGILNIPMLIAVIILTLGEFEKK